MNLRAQPQSSRRRCCLRQSEGLFARVNFFHPANYPAKNTFDSSTVCDEEDFTNADADPVDPVGVRYIFMFLFFQQKLYHISQIRLDSPQYGILKYGPNIGPGS